MPLAMRRLFVTILVYFNMLMLETCGIFFFIQCHKDFRIVHQFLHETQILSTLKSVEFYWLSMGKSYIDNDLTFIKLSDSNASTI